MLIIGRKRPFAGENLPDAVQNFLPDVPVVFHFFEFLVGSDHGSMVRQSRKEDQSRVGNMDPGREVRSERSV